MPELLLLFFLFLFSTGRLCRDVAFVVPNTEYCCFTNRLTTNIDVPCRIHMRCAFFFFFTRRWTLDRIRKKKKKLDYNFHKLFIRMQKNNIGNCKTAESVTVQILYLLKELALCYCLEL